jgi:hypothetical protein
MCENDTSLALSAALSDARYVSLWKEIADLASGENPRARYAGAGRVVEAGEAQPDPSARGDRWIVLATVAFRIEFDHGGDDVAEREVRFCVHGRHFPPDVDDVELTPFA